MANRAIHAVDDQTGGGAGRQLTVEQLAHETGMSVRNIRNHQSRGLLPPPEVRARIGYYGREHVTRLRLIQDMQAQGFKLHAIKRLIEGDGPSIDQLIGLRRAATAPFESESPEVLTVEELSQRFGADGDRELATAERLGLLVPIGDGLFEAPSPALLRAAEEVLAHGVSLAAALKVIEKVKRNAESTSRAFIELFLNEVVKPFNEAGQPQARWPEITQAIERLPPVASEALLATFKQTMQAEVETAFGRVVQERTKRSR